MWLIGMSLIQLAILIFCGLVWSKNSPLGYATAQCLSDNDDLSQAGSTDLSGILDFSLNLFQKLIQNKLKENFVFSPYSIWNALTLGYFGAGGNTAEELRSVLNLEDKVSTLRRWRSLEYMYLMRPQTTVDNTFIVANKAFFHDNVKIRQCMEDILHNEIQKLNFKKPQDAAKVINNFVANTTKGAIKELVTPSDVESALLVLANAAYFKGTWANPFDPRDTREAPFYGFDSAKYSVDMMSQNGNFKYAFDDKLQAELLELPYSSEAISMLLILPYGKDSQSFSKLINAFTPDLFDKVTRRLFLTNVAVTLPKFSLETYIGDELVNSLKNMGIKDAFNPKTADFTAFTYHGSINLDKSIHKAFIDIYEEGTEAAAATAVIATKLGGFSNFNCNRPFIFVIRDNDTKNLLFIGTYVVPKTEGNQRPSSSAAGGSQRETNNAFNPQDRGTIVSNNPRQPDRDRVNPFNTEEDRGRPFSTDKQTSQDRGFPEQDKVNTFNIEQERFGSSNTPRLPGQDRGNSFTVEQERDRPFNTQGFQNQDRVSSSNTQKLPGQDRVSSSNAQKLPGQDRESTFTVEQERDRPFNTQGFQNQDRVSSSNTPKLPGQDRVSSSNAQKLPEQDRESTFTVEQERDRPFNSQGFQNQDRVSSSNTQKLSGQDRVSSFSSQRFPEQDRANPTNSQNVQEQERVRPFTIQRLPDQDRVNPTSISQQDKNVSPDSKPTNLKELDSYLDRLASFFKG